MLEPVNVTNQPGFQIDLSTMNITMNRGDTGSFFLKATRESGESWTSDDRALYTIKDPQGVIRLQRIYRLDDQWEVGDGVILIEFHNDDTDDWEAGLYSTELRVDVSPVWEGTAPTERCVTVDENTPKMIEGPIVRTPVHATLEIREVYGHI